MRHAMLLLVALFVCPVPPALAETLDAGFGTNGVVLYDEPTDLQSTVAALPMPNGETVVVFNSEIGTTYCPGSMCFIVARLSSSGVKLASRVIAGFFQANAATVDGSGRIIVVSASTGNDTNFGIFRFRPDLGDDLTFSNDGFAEVDFFGQTDEPFAVATDAADNIVVAGRAGISPLDSDFAVARLQANGQLDITFSSDGKTTIAFDLAGGNIRDAAEAISIGNDGKILIGGYATDSSISLYRMALARLNANGTLDTSFCASGCTSPGYPAITSGRTIYYFGPNTEHRDWLNSVHVLANGGFLIAGDHQPDTFSDYRGGIARFAENGTLIMERLIQGLGTDYKINDVVGVDANGTRILVTGETGTASIPDRLVVQAFSGTLLPVANFGNCFADTSAICVQLSDATLHVAGTVRVDSLGRALLGGTGARMQEILIGGAARITNTNGPRPDRIFRTGFN